MMSRNYSKPGSQRNGKVFNIGWQFVGRLFVALVTLGGGVVTGQNLDTFPVTIVDKSEIENAPLIDVVRTANWALFDLQQPDSAAWWLDQIEADIIDEENSGIRGRYFFQKGQIKFYQQNLEGALQEFRKSIDIFSITGDSSQMYYAEAYRQAAEMQRLLRVEFAGAVANFQSAIRLFEYQKDTTSYLWATNNLAQLYGRNYFYQLAKEERSIVFRFALDHAYPKLRAVAHLTASIECEFQGNTEGFLAHLKEVEVACRQVPEEAYLRYFLHRFYLLYHYRSLNVEQAGIRFDSIEQTMRLLQNNKRYVDHFERDRATWYYLDGKLEAANELAENSLAKARQRKEAGDILVNLELLRKINFRLNRPGPALAYAEEELVIRDSLTRQSKITQSNFYENLYEQEKNAVLRANAQRDLQRIALRHKSRIRAYIILFVILLLLSLIVHVYRNYRDAQQEQLLQTKFMQDLIVTRVEEQKRIARELHDQVGQDLLVLQQKARAEENNEVVGMTMNLLQQLRSISHSLYDPTPDRIGMRLSIEQFIQKMDESSSVFFNLELPDQLPELPAKVQNHIFAIIQEFVRNAIEHAKPQAINVKLELKGDQLQVLLQDNGRGFDIQKEMRGIGLRVMQERARMMGVQLHFNSKKREGTRLFFYKKLTA